MAGRGDPRWSARATIEEDRILAAAAARYGVKKGTMLRAAVRLLEYPPIAPVLEHVVSGLSEKVPPAAAARGVSPDPGPAAAADSSPAVAAPPAAPEERQMLVSVVAELWACSRAGAVRGIRAGGVKVDGIEVTNPTALVLPSEVEL